MLKPIRSTIYLEPNLHKALKIKAAETDQSISGLVNAAVRQTILNDAEDLEAFEERRLEPTLSFEAVVKNLKRSRKR